jgi:hypothetical protein
VGQCRGNMFVKCGGQHGITPAGHPGRGGICHASALTTMRLRRQETCLVSKHLNSDMTLLAHSRANCRSRTTHECTRETPVGQGTGCILSILAYFVLDARHGLGQG